MLPHRLPDVRDHVLAHREWKVLQSFVRSPRRSNSRFRIRKQVSAVLWFHDRSRCIGETRWCRTGLPEFRHHAVDDGLNAGVVDLHRLEGSVDSHLAPHPVCPIATGDHPDPRFGPGTQGRRGATLTGDRIAPEWFVDPPSGKLFLTEAAGEAVDRVRPLPEAPEDITGRRRAAGPLADLGAHERR